MPVFNDAFVSYARKDSLEFAEELQQQLEQDGFAIWLDKTSIPAAEDWLRHIHEGIEIAHNFIFVISPGSLTSKYCRIELEYALSLNKRIVPLLHIPLPTTEELRKLAIAAQRAEHNENKQQEINQTIDFVREAIGHFHRIEFDSVEHYETAFQTLITTLRRDFEYVKRHTALLTQALKWDRHDRPPAMLLRGYNLKHAIAWWSIAEKNPEQRPTELQTELIQCSEATPPEPTLDVFISYSQQDAAEFAHRLNEELQTQGKHTWFDQESIAPEVDFQQEIYRGIESAKVFLFILSPQAVISPFCEDEVDHASKLGKRILTVLYQDIERERLHPQLKTIPLTGLIFVSRRGFLPTFKTCSQPLT